MAIFPKKTKNKKSNKKNEKIYLLILKYTKFTFIRISLCDAVSVFHRSTK